MNGGSEDRQSGRRQERMNEGITIGTVNSSFRILYFVSQSKTFSLQMNVSFNFSVMCVRKKLFCAFSTKKLENQLCDQKIAFYVTKKEQNRCTWTRERRTMSKRPSKTFSGKEY